jgi:hypothetical protein
MTIRGQLYHYVQKNASDGRLALFGHDVPEGILRNALDEDFNVGNGDEGAGICFD